MTMNERDQLIAELDAILSGATPADMQAIAEARRLNAEVDAMLALGYTQNERGEWVSS